MRLLSLIWGSKTRVDFEALHSHHIQRYSHWIKRDHQGHDLQVDQLLESMDRTLKHASPGKTLGAFMVHGPEGTGKSQLARMLGQAFFGRSHIIEFDFSKIERTEFLTLFSEMVEAVQSDPHQMIVLENIDHIDSTMLMPLMQILTTGQWVYGEAPRTISFAGCLFLATTRSKKVDPRFLTCAKVVSWGTTRCITGSSKAS